MRVLCSKPRGGRDGAALNDQQVQAPGQAEVAGGRATGIMPVMKITACVIPPLLVGSIRYQTLRFGPQSAGRGLARGSCSKPQRLTGISFVLC